MKAALRATAAAAADGRVQRGERSRDPIVSALLTLIGDGHAQPTAQQVADRAGVGIRSVFRHFSEVETLYAEMDARLDSEAVTAPERAGSAAFGFGPPLARIAPVRPGALRLGAARA